VKVIKINQDFPELCAVLPPFFMVHSVHELCINISALSFSIFKNVLFICMGTL